MSCGRGDASLMLGGEVLVVSQIDGEVLAICTVCDPSLWDLVAAMRSDCPICSGRSAG